MQACWCPLPPVRCPSVPALGRLVLLGCVQSLFMPRVRSALATKTFAYPELLRVCTSRDVAAGSLCINQSVHHSGWPTPLLAHVETSVVAVASLLALPFRVWRRCQMQTWYAVSPPPLSPFVPLLRYPPPTSPTRYPNSLPQLATPPPTRYPNTLPQLATPTRNPPTPATPTPTSSPPHSALIVSHGRGTSFAPLTCGRRLRLSLIHSAWAQMALADRLTASLSPARLQALAFVLGTGAPDCVRSTVLFRDCDPPRDHGTHIRHKWTVPPPPPGIDPAGLDPRTLCAAAVTAQFNATATAGRLKAS
jgi:hypothetical protein